MELSVVFMLFAAGWTISLALPIQVTEDNISVKDPALNNETKTVFEQIMDANKDITKPLSGGDIAEVISRSAIKCQRCMWDESPNGMVYVPYVISPQYTKAERSVITSALQEFEVMTCLTFAGRTAEKNYISIESGSGCWSSIGRIGGKQTVSLSKSGCVSYGVVQHEIMHTLGFLHEHNRSDRDNYVDIMWKYINDDDQSNFLKDDANNLGLPYDYSSVMHYYSTVFSNTSGKATIVTIPDPKPIGQRLGMSGLDIQKINTLYNCNVCRTKLTDPSGTFSDISNPLGPQEDSCLWLIQVPRNKVFLQLTDLNIPSSAGCSDGFIKIYDGDNKLANVLVDKTCGNGAIPPITASGNKMLVEVHGSKIAGLKRFNASYRTVSYGGTFNTDKGEVTSPDYPDYEYPSNADALWTIIAPKGYKVSLTFGDFVLQYSSKCSNDYLTVIDGATLTAPVLGTFCGSKMPPNLVSAGNVIMVQFHSDASCEDWGFQASYKFASPFSRHAEPVFISLYGTDFATVSLTFGDFVLQYSSKCSNDYLTVIDGATLTAPVLGTFCGSKMPPNLVSAGNVIMVQFHSDASCEDWGFQASYKFVKHK
ncbi:astacin-like metalloendopeptidase [Pelodytes ibericus]